ncbi:MAG: alcohol dehydrogenase catalytic domain-containing protein [Spirochaetota bacterium]|nr:MAG: alcohol dehydrogenase catalytic domain-containing protein [Spirochaetota bacterium]
MSSTCRAVVWKGKGHLEVVERQIPKPDPKMVLLKVRAAGICGTDLHILSGTHPHAHPPLVPGHEFAGEVYKIGKGVDKKLIGARVGSDSYVGCGECMYCRSKKTQLCEKGTRELGVNIDGGWTEYLTVPVENLYLIPENVDFTDVGAGCILNCPMAAVESVKINPSDMVVIIGDGPSSLVMIQLARLKGASKVIIAGHRERRLSLALEFGADHVINTYENDLIEFISELGSAPQVVIDAVGKAETVGMALTIAEREGRVHLFGLPEGPLNNISMDILLWKEITLTGSTGAPGLWPPVMELLSRGYLKVAPIISHRFRIEEAPKAIEFINDNPKQVIKAIFEMQ